MIELHDSALMLT